MQARLSLLLAAFLLLPALAWAASPFAGAWRGDASGGGVRTGLSLTITGDGTVSGTLALAGSPLQLSGFVGDDGRATLVGRDPARSLRRVLGSLQLAGGGLAGFLDVTAPTGQAPLHYLLQLAQAGAQVSPPVAAAPAPNATTLGQLFATPAPSPAPAAPPPATRPDARMLSELFAKPAPPPPPAPAPAPAVAPSPTPAPAPQPTASAPPRATRPDARMLSGLFATRPAPAPAPAPAAAPAPPPPARRAAAIPSPAGSSKAGGLDAPVGPPPAAAPAVPTQSSVEPKDPVAVASPGAAASPFAGDWIGKVDVKSADISLRIAPDGSIIPLPGGPNDGPVTGKVDPDGHASMSVSDKDQLIPLDGQFDLVGDRIFVVVKVQTPDFHGKVGINLQRVPGPGAQPQAAPSRFAGLWNGFAETMSDLDKRDMSITVDPDGNFDGTIGGTARGHLDVAGWIRPDGRTFVSMFDNTGDGGVTDGQAMLDVNGNGLFGQITTSDEDGHAKGHIAVVLDKGG